MKRLVGVVGIGCFLAIWVSMNVVLTLDAYGLDTAKRLLLAVSAGCGGVGIGIPVRLAERRGLTSWEVVGLVVAFIAYATALMGPQMELVAAMPDETEGDTTIYWLTAVSFALGVLLCLLVPWTNRPDQGRPGELQLLPRSN